jgi:hypothetical protein
MRQVTPKTKLQQRFERDGYVVIPGLLSPTEAAYYRTEIQNLSGVGDADFGKKLFGCADGVSKNRQFWPLIDHPRLIPAVRELLGPTARYTQHSDLHAHRGGVGWHRDSACRNFGEGPDWDESQDPYQVVRVAIYLQTYAESHSSLGVIPGSHRYEQLIWGREAAFWRRWIALREIATSTWGKLTRDERLPNALVYSPGHLPRVRPGFGPSLVTASSSTRGSTTAHRRSPAQNTPCTFRTRLRTNMVAAILPTIGTSAKTATMVRSTRNWSRC